jgi:foldase protein PrsA
MKRKLLSLLVAATVSSTLLCSCAMTDSKALIKINGNEGKIEFGYGNFVARLTQAMYDVTYSSYAGSDMWTSDYQGKGTTLQEDVKKNVIDTLEEQYVLKKHAKDYGVKITAKKEKEIKTAAEKFMKDNSSAAIKQLGANEKYVTKYLEDRYVVAKVKSKIEAKADTTVTDEEANQKTISYVYFNTRTKTDSDGNTSAVSDDEKKTMKSNAESLVTAEDFEKRTTDIEMTSTKLSFGQSEIASAKKSGSMTDTNGNSIPYAVLKAADKLADGEVSSVVEDESGYYVAKMDTTNDADATATEKTKLEQNKTQEYYDKVYEGLKAKYAWKVDKNLWKSVKFIDRFKGSIIDTDKKTKN